MMPYIHKYRHRVTANDAEKKQNGEAFKDYLTVLGWSLNAICAALGNWEVETYLNPNYPQFKSFPDNWTVTPSKDQGGFGMPHWTGWYAKIGKWAYDKYGIRATATDDNPLASFELQMEYHEYECVYGVNGGKTWYPNHGYHYTWQDWKTSTDPVEKLADAYYWQYERSFAGAAGTRPARAKWWYEYFTGGVIPPDPPPVINLWLLFKFDTRR